MRAGEYRPNHYHPTAMSIMIKELRIDCYWFLRVDDGKIGAPLHRQCTVVVSLKLMKQLPAKKSIDIIWISKDHYQNPVRARTDDRCKYLYQATYLDMEE